MTILRIAASGFRLRSPEAAFESDPVGLGESGVRRRRIMGAADDPDYVW